MTTPPDEITTTEAMSILGYSDRSTIVGMVRDGRLEPSRKLPGKTGAYLFDRALVVGLAERAAEERRAHSAEMDRRLSEAKSGSGGAGA